MPLNRFVTFVKPYLNLLAGAIAAWLVAGVNVLGIPGLGQHGSELQTGIAAALAWGVTLAATQIGDLKWLEGHHLSMVGDAPLQTAAPELQAPAPQVPATAPRSGAHEPEHAALISIGERLPGDAQELSAPPLRVHATSTPSAPLDTENEALIAIEELPDDDDEFAAPPPDETNMPIQPSQAKVDGGLA